MRVIRTFATSRVARLLAVAGGSWRFWATSALAASAVVATAVIYQVYFASGEAGSYPYYKLIRTSTDAADRLLLMNRIKTSVKSPVDYDSYNGQTTVSKTSRNWWEVLDSEDAPEPTGSGNWVAGNCNLKAGSHIRLHAKGAGGRVLWELFNCRIGNLNPKTTAGTLKSFQNGLPWSNTGYSYSSRTRTADQTTAGTLVMQNTPESRVVSSCYADGIGTIYFDAVNGFTGYKKGQLVVEAAYGVFKTNAVGSVESRNIPDDLELAKDADGNDIPGRYVAPDAAHCDEIRRVGESGGAVLTQTNAYGRCAWVRVNLSGHVFGNDAGPLAAGDVLALDLPRTGAAGSFGNFFRVWAPVQDPSVNPALAARCRGPMRFQIRRLDDPAVLGTYGMNLDGDNLGEPANNGLVSLDNIIVSYPAMLATAEPRGAYVAGGSRRNVIGWTGALSAKYPAAGESGLTAEAGLSLATNAPPDSSVTDAWVAGIHTTMKYRWRHLSVTNDWQGLALTVNGEALVSTAPLTLPGLPGDLEYYYETELDAPYYGYVDYSGKNAGTPGYCERVKRVESRLDPAAIGVGGLPSTGTDFFTRLREGKSDQLEFRLQIRRAAGASVTNELPFHLSGNLTWKAFARTTTNKTSTTAFPAGDYLFRVVGVDPAVTFGGNEVTALPWSGKRLYRSADADGGWTKITMDAVTGALMFLVMEDVAFPDEMTYTVVHADYQDFNRWSDAVSHEDPPTYVGAYSETKGRQSGSSPDTREYASELGNWSATAVANAAYWTEKFAISSPRKPEEGWGAFAAYEAFARCVTPNGWLAQNGQWVCAQWRESVAGGNLALLLDGAGKGTLSFTNTKEMPHGVETFALKARVAQGAKFDDFAYYYGAPLESLQNYVFTMRAVMGTSDAQTSSFDGNGSVSLVGYYQPGEGCYEVRAERIATDTVRLSLYKWAYDEDEREVRPRLLGRHAATRRYVAETYLRCNRAGVTQSDQKDGYYGELFIRCRSTTDGTVIDAGVMNAGKKLGEMTSGTSHYCLRYVDTESPYRFGTYGFGSLNCPAQLIKPQFYADGTAGTFPNVTGKSKDADGNDLSNPACGSGTVSYSGTPEDLFYTSESPTKYKNWTFKSGVFACADIASQKGVTAVPPTGRLELFVTEDGAERSVGTVDVTGFTFDTNCTFTVRSSADALLRLATGSRSADVVVDDVAFTQWCAASYSDEGNADFSAHSPSLGCPTNFVYLNGWVSVTRADTNDVHTIRLAPARVRAGGVASIRAPLMDGLQGRGLGLGMLSYTYRDADSNCVIRVQCREIEGASSLRAVTADADGWTDVATNDFSKMTAEERKAGTLSTYVGAHGLQGAMRLVIDDQVVRDAQDEAKNPGRDPAYGSIEIVDFLSRDEPKIDDRCWWGWNLRTTDALAERSLYDGLATDVGLALALNDSATEDVEAEYADLYPQKLPFVQTPTFATNIVGELSFRARRLPGAEGDTEVAILGAKDGGVLDESQWTLLDTVVVTNDAYCQYSYKTKDGDDYAAFRLAVIGVAGVSPNHADKMKIPAPARVLIDEVSVSEAVRGKLAFRDVAAFRSGLDRNTPVANVTAKSEQPLVKEAWGVQGEVYIAQMEEEIDVAKGIEVFLHWYRGQEPWGFGKWRGLPGARSAALTQAAGTSAWIYRSSYLDCPAAVIVPAQTNEVVQYSLEVRYWPQGADHSSTNFLSSADWTTPSWYRPVDFNAGRGPDEFAAYTILDTVAPGWAWINEINFFGSYNGLWMNSDDPRQYVEVAMPREADLTDWTLRFLDGNPQSGAIYTNVVARFGRDIGPGPVAATKTKNVASNCVFLVVASNEAKNSGALSEADGEVDGYWLLSTRGTSAFGSEHQIVANNPVGIQLVRPSGIVEHELLMIGTNFWEGTALDSFDPQEHVDFFNASARAGAFFFAGREHGGDPCSLGAFRNAGATSNDWNCTMKRTPGRVNEEQEIDPSHPTPFGSAVLVYLNLGPHLAQSVGGAAATRENQLAVVPKGDPDGLDVEYAADRWHVLGSVTTNGAPAGFVPSGPRTYRVNVAKNCSNDTLTVEAAAAISPALVEGQGLTADNRYREAIMDWLVSRKDLNGNAWVDDGGETIRPAEFWSYDGTFQTNLSLTAMYWLDIPPTEGNWVVRGGMTDVQPHCEQAPAGSGLTNVQVRVYLMISNKLETAGWATSQPHRLRHAPYALRGLKPGSSSWGYSPSAPSSDRWNDVTFKITGLMQNGKTDPNNRNNHVPLRWFVFDEGSFHPRGHAQEFQATVDVRYPYTKESPAQAYGVREWLWAHPDVPDSARPPFFYFWSLDERLQPLAVEVLRPNSTY